VNDPSQTFARFFSQKNLTFITSCCWSNCHLRTYCPRTKAHRNQTKEMDQTETDL
jgi:hypothetical protein